MFSSSISSPQRAKRLNAAIVTRRGRGRTSTHDPAFLAMENSRPHRQHRFDQHPRVPGPTRTDFPIGGITGLGMEAGICQDHHPVIKLGNQGVKMGVVHIGGGAVPGTHQAPLVQDEAELPADNPAMIALPLLAYLIGTPSFAHRVDQLDARGVRHAEHRGGGQKPCGPRRGRLQEPCQARTLRHVGKQRQGVARQPALEGAGPTTFDGIQQRQRHDFTRREFGVRMCGDLHPLLGHRIEQSDNTIWGSHTTGSSRLKASQPQLEPVCDSLSTCVLDITYQTNTIG